MSWINSERNYENYAGRSWNEGRTKETYHGEIRRLIERSAGYTDRSEKDIKTKIVSLEKSVRDTTDWFKCIRDRLENPGDVQEYIKNKWPQYYDLELSMSNRPNTTPLLTSDGREEVVGEEQDHASGQDVITHYDGDNKLHPRESTQPTPSSPTLDSPILLDAI